MKINQLLADLRGTTQLACDATVGVTGVVEQVHGTILRVPMPLGQMKRKPDAGLARLVYGSIRTTTRVVDWTIGAALNPFLPSGPDSGDVIDGNGEATERDRVVAALNGVLGDHLEASGNPLAQSMALRVHEPAGLPCAESPRRWLLLVHGLCMHDRQWTRNGHDHGVELGKALGMTPVYLRYNTGLSVAENGQRLSRELKAFTEQNLGENDELSVLCYSLGGLVSRSALSAAASEDHEWVGRLDKVAFLGTPHAGAPLAKGGHHIDQALGLSPYSAAFSRLAKSRSAGLRDLRRGLGRSLTEIPEGVETFSIAGGLAEKDADNRGDRGRVGRLLGDGLVSMDSALADHVGVENEPDENWGAAKPQNHWVAPGVSHMELLGDQGVYKQLLGFFRQPS